MTSWASTLELVDEEILAIGCEVKWSLQSELEQEVCQPLENEIVVWRAAPFSHNFQAEVAPLGCSEVCWPWSHLIAVDLDSDFQSPVKIGNLDSFAHLLY